MVANLLQFSVKKLLMDNYNKINEEVYYFNKPITYISNKDIKFIKNKAKKNYSQKCRLCTHKNEKDNFQEMFIVHTKNCYIRPHYHIDKVESLQVIEGKADLYIFNTSGHVISKKLLGDPLSKRTYYYRINKKIIHMLIIKSDFFVFKETASKPFNRKMMIFPKWSPEYFNFKFFNKVIRKK